MAKEEKLGELIFNGTILFLSISFGLFTLSLSSGKITVSSVALFIAFIVLVLIAGMTALFCSFMGIKTDNIKWISAGGIALLIMIIFLIVVYAQVYLNTLNNITIISKN